RSKRDWSSDECSSDLIIFRLTGLISKIDRISIQLYGRNLFFFDHIKKCAVIYFLNIPARNPRNEKEIEEDQHDHSDQIVKDQWFFRFLYLFHECLLCFISKQFLCSALIFAPYHFSAGIRKEQCSPPCTLTLLSSFTL